MDRRCQRTAVHGGRKLDPSGTECLLDMLNSYLLLP
eukprot:COSAG02_NODE_66599_length_255_cov_0.647436_1_plen_35_part_10